MKNNKRMYQKNVKKLSYAVFALLLPVSAAADPTTAEQAEQVVQNWLALDQQPLGANFGSKVENVQAYNDENGQPLYYVVNLSPKGFVIVAGDDYVEPIIAFIPDGEYDPSDKKPLGALVSRDVPGRVQHVRAVQAVKGAAALQEAENDSLLKAQAKWDRLEQEDADRQFIQAAGLDSIDDVRVAPLLQSRWGQSTVSGINVYNRYTPNNYVSGCVATAMSQVMRYFQHSSPVVQGSYIVKVDGVSQTTGMYGGNGSGSSAYTWSNMPYVPDSSITVTEQNAIGWLLHDAGASVCMDYTSSSSGAYMTTAGQAFKNIFGYSNAVNGAVSGWADIPATERNKMTNPNLDARNPVLYGIADYEGNSGHAIVCDGYGYNASTMYHHLNMGWDGYDDAWYNLPNMGTGYNFSVINTVIYNIYPSGTGEIISGRVTDSSGTPLSEVTITATGGYTASTNDEGIYALAKVPSSSSYTITASKAGYTFSSEAVSTETSENYFNSNSDPCVGTGTLGAGTVGNVWGVDFTALVVNGPEMDVWGNNITIVSGDTTPTTSDHTNFGKTLLGVPVSRTYTIANVGNETLNLTDTPVVSLTGAECTSEFSVTQQPETSMEPSGTTTFTVQYSPTDAKDSDTCTVTIGNNDSNENPYTFTIKGTEGKGSVLPAVYELLL